MKAAAPTVLPPRKRAVLPVLFYDGNQVYYWANTKRNIVIHRDGTANSGAARWLTTQRKLSLWHGHNGCSEKGWQGPRSGIDVKEPLDNTWLNERSAV